MTVANPKGDSTIAGLPLAQTLSGAETIPADQSQSGTLVTVRIPVSQLISQIPAGLFGLAFSVWFNSLPTSLPAQSGVFWNNGGTLAQS